METATQIETASTLRSAIKTVAPELVKPCTYGAANPLESGRLSPLLSANEAFARRTTQVLSSRLGLACEVVMQSSDQIPGRTFLQKAGDTAYIVSIYLEPRHEVALLYVDSMLLFPLVDILLGGKGQRSEISREVTDIEDQIAKELIKIICQEFQSAWKAFHVDVTIGMRQSSAELQRMFSPADKTLMFSFTVNLPEAGGGFQLLVPSASSSVFLHAATEEAPAQKMSTTRAVNTDFGEKLLESRFNLDLTLLGGKVEANHLLNLNVGKILTLGISVRTPVVLQIGGRDAFEAVPVRSGHHRAAQLIDRAGQSSAASN
jgi:flagellar motor switch protein FliM